VDGADAVMESCFDQLVAQCECRGLDVARSFIPCADCGFRLSSVCTLRTMLTLFLVGSPTLLESCELRRLRLEVVISLVMYDIRQNRAPVVLTGWQGY
jgi:hypothetical protein